MLLAITSWLSPSREFASAEEPPQFDASALEFFEKDVRPLLVKHCYECHGPEAKRLEGNLLLTSRENALKGGDTGPAVVPGDLDESLLIDAVRYGEYFEMPPKGKLPAAEIAILERWVKMGAPWPAGNSGPDPRQKFDLDERRKSHWAWQPVRDAAPPAVNDKSWPRDPLDQFILARLEREKLSPNGSADARTLMRRLHFDLIGLPPTPEEVNAFLKDCGLDPALSDDQPAKPVPPAAIERLVDKLLASPHFGERWGRHWLDLMRYAESRGHEFDFESPNAFEYRDYVIRALNADVPYDQFVVEHIAGDLLEKPRTHPEQGFNESIIGTGFWHLGEWVHSPVDIRQDECDRLDNQIDTFSKAFLGMTVACARCHDHKFDAISQADYYALAGFVQSSDYRLARFESLDHNRRIARQLHDLREKSGREMARLTLPLQRPVLDKLDRYLLAAREAIVTPAENPEPSAEPKTDAVFADFESGSYDGWTVEGEALADKPVSGTQPRQQTVSGWQGKFYVNTYPGSDGPHGKAISRPFKIERRYIMMLVGGGAHAGQTCMNLVVDGKVVRTVTGKENERLDPAFWDVGELGGKEARLEIVDSHSGGWGHINVDHIVFTDHRPASGEPSRPSPSVSPQHVAAVATKHGLDAGVLQAWVEHLAAAKNDANDPLHLWGILAHDGHNDDAQLAATLQRIAADIAERAAQLPQALVSSKMIVDYTAGGTVQFMADGSAFGVAPMKIGDVLMGSDASAPLAGFASYGSARRDLTFTGLSLAPGSQNEVGGQGGWQRPGQSLRTPTFTIEEGPVHYLVRGAGRAFAVVDSHRMIGGPLHGEVLRDWNDDAQGRLHWVTHNLQRQKGHRAHIEFTPKGNELLEVLMVVQGARAPAMPIDESGAVLLARALAAEGVRSLGDVAFAYRSLLDDAASVASRGFPEETDRQPQAALANWIAQHPALFITPDAKASEAGAKLASAAKEYVESQQQLAAQIKRVSRAAPAMWDGSAENELLLIRGKPSTPGEAVPRRILSALGGKAAAAEHGSGRLALAQEVVDPANPLTSRVMANRVWHHLFGVGIVPSTDNFGVLGEAPTHPELLDHLATRFMREGWSVKQLIKAIVLSRTYQMSSRPRVEAEQIDPANKWLHRMNIRRLEGEIVRDSLLALSGRLDRTAYGPPVPVHLTEFMTGRGRPAGGPLDGNGRRSIYISVRRNFLSPIMLAFDVPQPSATVGRRTVSNVPAQALIMMNDPLVVQQTRLWATRVLAEKSLSPEERIARLYEMAFARLPTAEETAGALAFIDEQGARLGIAEAQRATALDAWADLCHVLVNVKEFVFVN
jgi:hypothetical protein